jgi:hypothetical protein
MKSLEYCDAEVGTPHVLRLTIASDNLHETTKAIGSRVAQSVQCLTTDWTTGRSSFDFRQRQEDFSSNICFQNGSGARPASCTVDTGGSFLRR